jgi:S-DNA-T family DNA segregation ATPase FtsK/SpoIIIE
MLLAVFLLIAFVSYIFTGAADQSVVNSIFDTPLRRSGRESANFYGVIGAYVAHQFIFRWFGISALLLVPVVFFSGLRLAWQRDFVSMRSLSIQVLFYLFWGSAALGFVVLASESEQTLSWLCGGIGYEVNVFLHSLLGWFSVLVVAFVLFLFAVYFYGFTSLDQVVGKLEAQKEDNYDDEYETDDVPPRPQATSPKNLPKSDDTVELPSTETDPIDEDAVIKAKVSSLAAEAASEWQKPSNGTPPKASGVGKGLTFTVEVPQEDDTPLLPEAEDKSTSVNEEVLRNFGLYDPTLDLAGYQFPTVELLKDYPSDRQQVNPEELEANKNKIVETLGEFDIGIASIKATVGPTVTLYEIIPDAGVRISKIRSLEDDIALKLAALGIRIIAPIPGRGTIGIEVPNKQREMVSIRSLIGSEKFQKTTMELPVVLGKNISNEIFLTDLAGMPHLLIAGATGQGKSVGLNVLLTSLLYKKHPAQLKFVLVDPKKVELSLFSKIERHFLAKLPNNEEAIITDTKKVINTLDSLCKEMEIRYNLLKEAECRNIKEYNAKFVQRRLNPEKGHRFLPYIVLVIDELADLMMTAGKEVEQPIARLAQLARAIGIHLVVATQRPSVNVITGIIKANFPVRLSFKVTAKVDSRTILDTGGAEQLVSKGDMLLSQGSDMIRLQCAFVDTPEVENVCDFIGAQSGYSSAYMLPESDSDESGQGEDLDSGDLDPMFEEAARLIVLHQQGSTSLIQRKLQLGYNRAGRLIDQLEKVGIVGAFSGSKAREVIVKTTDELEEILKRLR